MLLILQNIFRFAIFLLILVLNACDNNQETEGTVFEPPAWVLALSNGGLAGDTVGDNTTVTSGPVDFYGVKATIDDVAEPLIIAETNTIVQQTQVTKNLIANGIADDGETILTLSWTVLQTVAPPADLMLVFTPVANDQAGFAYSESLTSTPPNAVTSIVSGVLKLQRWNDIQVRGTFQAQVILADGTTRSISDGTINVRF